MVICLNLATIGVHSNQNIIIEEHLIAIAFIPLWLKNMKYFRAFEVTATFIIVLGRILIDIAKFLFLYFEFFIAYAFSYWLMFGGNVSMSTISETFYFVFRISIHDIWLSKQSNIQGSFAAFIIVMTHIGLVSILSLSLFVAVVNNAFNRASENINASVLMQRIDIIIQTERNWFDCMHHGKLQSFIKERCAPLEERYQKMNDNRKVVTLTSLKEQKAAEEKELLDAIWTIKVKLADCRDIITKTTQNKVKSQTSVSQAHLDSKKAKMEKLQKDIVGLHQEIQILDLQQNLIDDELQSDLKQLQQNVEHLCEVYRSQK
eukprot:gi/632980316/ref/XP_007906966.1/ PREDICTED: uncharacterized protein LOC103188703 [Callorhinchus milii]